MVGSGQRPCTGDVVDRDVAQSTGGAAHPDTDRTGVLINHETCGDESDYTLAQILVVDDREAVSTAPNTTVVTLANRIGQLQFDVLITFNLGVVQDGDVEHRLVTPDAKGSCHSSRQNGPAVAVPFPVV